MLVWTLKSVEKSSGHGVLTAGLAAVSTAGLCYSVTVPELQLFL